MADENKSSWFSSWGSGLLGSAIGGLFGIGQQLIGNKFNREEAQKNRDFQSHEAELNRIFQSNEAAMQRDWSSQEAERARDWQEEMNYKYNSLAGKIRQAEDAGVNPMLAVTGNAVSPASASTSAPSGASAGSVGTPSGSSASAGFVDIIGSILGMAKLKSEIENTEADTERKKSETEGQKITNEQLRDMNAADIMSKLSQVQLNDSNIELISSKILNTDADTRNKGLEFQKLGAEISNLNVDIEVKRQNMASMVLEMAKTEAATDLLRVQSDEASQRYNNLVQEFGHNEVVNAITEVSLGRDSGVGEHSNGYYRTVSEVKRFIDSCLGWFSGGASVTKNLLHKN